MQKQFYMLTLAATLISLSAISPAHAQSVAQQIAQLEADIVIVDQNIAENKAKIVALENQEAQLVKADETRIKGSEAILATLDETHKASMLVLQNQLTVAEKVNNRDLVVLLTTQINTLKASYHAQFTAQENIIASTKANISSVETSEGVEIDAINLHIRLLEANLAQYQAELIKLLA